MVKDAGLTGWDSGNTELNKAFVTLVTQTGAFEDNGIRYDMKPVRETEDGFEENKRTVSNMKPVKKLTGNEFSVGTGTLKDDVGKYFEQIGGSAYNEELGDIELTRRGIKDALSHGVGKEKAVAFAAVKEVIEQGRVIDYQRNWKNRQYDTAVVAAPVEIAGKDYFMGLVIKRKETQRYYLHELMIQKNSGIEGRSTEHTDKNAGRYFGGVNPTIVSILQELRKYKSQNEQISKNNGENEEAIRYSMKDGDEIEDAYVRYAMKDGDARSEEEIRQEYREDISPLMEADEEEDADVWTRQEEGRNFI